MDNESSGFKIYTLFHALKLHFTTTGYDYFKYNGKVKLTKESFLNNRAKYYYYKISRKYSWDEARDYFIANMILPRSDNKMWIGDFVGEQYDQNYAEWLKNQQALTYTFKKDVDNLFDQFTPDDMLKVKDGYPGLLFAMMEKYISIETVVILDDLLGFMPMWERNIKEDIIWPIERLRLVKYKPFVRFDQKKFKDIVKLCLTEHK